MGITTGLIKGDTRSLDYGSYGLDVSSWPAAEFQGGFSGNGGYVGKLRGGFPQWEGTFLGVPIMRIIVCWGLNWGPPI